MVVSTCGIIIHDNTAFKLSTKHLKMSKIDVPLSKTKIVFVIGGSLLFVVLGYYLFTSMANQQTRFNILLAQGAGIVSMLFFGATLFYGIKKMFDKTIGLTVDENGIWDNTNASSVGLIKWTDITEIRTAQIASTKFLLIFTTNPEFYLNKAQGFKRKLMEGNNQMYGTPLSISAATLKYSFHDLEKLLTDKLNEQREKMLNL
jgi:hypothetical protein